MEASAGLDSPQHGKLGMVPLMVSSTSQKASLVSAHGVSAQGAETPIPVRYSDILI